MITEVGPGLKPGSAQVVDADEMIAMPGLINAHTHSGQNLDRGMAPNLPLDLWLMWVVFGNISISVDDRYTLAMAGALEMLESGCTAVLDHGWVPPWDFDDYSEAIMSAYADAGMRGRAGPDDRRPRHLRHHVLRRAPPGPSPRPWAIHSTRRGCWSRWPGSSTAGRALIPG